MGGLFEQLPHIAPVPDSAVGCGRASAAEAEQGLKSLRLLASIVSENELVQVHLHLPAADSVMGADQPSAGDSPIARSPRHDRGGPLRRAGCSGCLRAMCLKPAAYRPVNPSSLTVQTLEPSHIRCKGWAWYALTLLTMLYRNDRISQESYLFKGIAKGKAFLENSTRSSEQMLLLNASTDTIPKPDRTK